jgi:hypothetical protein
MSVTNSTLQCLVSGGYRIYTVACTIHTPKKAHLGNGWGPQPGTQLPQNPLAKNLKDAGIFGCLLRDKFSLTKLILTLPIKQDRLGIISFKINFYYSHFWPIFMFYTFLFTVPADVGIEPRTVSEIVLTVRAAGQ